MNACEMLYDHCKSVLQMVQMLKNAVANAVANLTNVIANETRTRRMGN